jgi:DNA-binding transcriptional MerR regulator
MNQPSSESVKLTTQQFANLVARFREHLETDSKTRAMFAGMCGSLERAQMFTQTKGVGITQFAKLMNVPTTTVRHYLRLGLVTPYEVNGKFRFKPHNVVQFESVQQWHELGMTLEEVIQFRLSNNFNQSVVRPDARKTVTTIRRLTDEEYQKLQAVVGEDMPFKKVTVDQLRQAGLEVEGSSPHQYLLAEYKALREKLEARKAKIVEQLARVAQLEAALAEAKG